MTFKISKSRNNKFYFVLKANNNETVLRSEMYESKQACKKGIKIVRWSFFSKIIDTTEK